MPTGESVTPRHSAPTKYDPNAARDPRGSIGQPGEPVRALAFAGGVFDAAMQLGSVHALLVSNSAPPDVVVGISTGAINAVAAAEILQAGAPGATPREIREAKVARFREVLEAYRQSPEDVLAAFLPDIYQVDAEKPLKPTDLPIYKEPERADRLRAARSRAGLIKLTNDLLNLDVSIGSIARVVRASLGMRALAEVRPVWKRSVGITIEAWRLWKVVASNVVALAPIGVRLVQIAIAPHADRFGEWVAESPWARRVFNIIAAPVPRVTSDQLVRLVAAGIAKLGSQREVGATAGSILFRGAIAKGFGRSMRWMAGFAVLGTVTGLPLLLVVSVVAAIAYYTSDEAKLLLTEFHHALDAASLDGWLHAATKMQIRWIVVFALAVLVIFRLRSWLSIDRILRYYGISDALLDPYPLRSWFVKLFDPTYHGANNMDAIVEAALTTQHLDAEPAENIAAKRRTLRDYAAHKSPIHVAPMAANVQTGQLTVLDAETPVVEALLAATAMPPFFEARNCGNSWYIDGTVVANEPSRALLSYLTPLVHEDSTAVHIYPASSLPLGASELGVESAEYSGLVDSSRRALTLRAFRDATLDRRTMGLVTRALPGNRATWWPGREKGEPRGDKQQFLRASLFPIDLDAGVSLNERLLGARSLSERRALIVESVAQGCRLSLEVLLDDKLVPGSSDVIPCRRIIEERVGPDGTLPGSSKAGGPGLPEVCRACTVRHGPAASPSTSKQSLRVPKESRNLPLWPMETNEGATIYPLRSSGPTSTVSDNGGEAPPPRARKKPTTRFDTAMPWPLPRNGVPGIQRPTVNLLFSGGVFRGVYLAGVVTGLSEVGAQPDVIAGSSIGSITAAMAARLFATPATDVAERRRRLLRMCATYLAVDRLVLTDRFSDFIRNFTLRAGATTFSLRDIDTAFRVYDRSKTERFGRELRKVLAGLERLLYLSPFEARDLAHAFRMRRYDDVKSLLGVYAQEWLERGAVGSEILGSEPLALLIAEHVLDGKSAMGGDPAAEFITKLGASGIQFIATATNLTRGRLDALHIPATTREQRPRLVEALLASSAFPAVFRPRWTWEVIPETSEVEQYIDGGVMDNLPLDAVARFLHSAHNAGKVAARPMVGGISVPHLLFTGSLEVERPDLTDAATAFTAKRWIEMFRRSRELSYNGKIDNYASTQRALRAIMKADPSTRPGDYLPLDLEVVTVKPQWLCGTFAFHPMLGFRREDQARSIAHGCRTTLEAMHALGNTNPEWVDAWGIKPPEEFLPEAESEYRAQGDCWYRPGCRCPFSKQGIDAAAAPALAPNTRAALERIYQLCAKKRTHARRDPSKILDPAKATAEP
jgi:predicted acylesterase/phospholipase RssA